MENKQILNLSFAFSIIICVIGALFKILHYPYSEILLGLGLISLLVFWIVAISELKASTKISGNEKFMWTIALLFLGSFAGLIYLTSARKRIV